MISRRAKTICFTLEGLNSFAATFYFNYLFFFLRDNFGFDNRKNLWVTALHGFIYIFAAWQGGRFGQRRGYFHALKLGYAGAALFLAAGAFLTGSVAGQLAVVAGWTVMVCFTWPALEALISEGEGEESLPRMVGIYNVVWAGTGALGYFCGGAIFEALGWKALFWLPAGLFAMQFAIVLWLENNAGPEKLSAPPPAAAHAPEAVALTQPVSPKTFLQMAWLGNPIGYIAINTVLAVIPQLAHRLGLSVAMSGLFCSAWYFARLGTFVALWKWTGWHYRFRWLVVAFVALIASFAMLLLASQLWLLLLAQLGFGAAVGLLYYSSLFYSMDVGEAKGDHGGLHEAFIGAGIFAGTAVGATALQLFPQCANAGTWAVSGLLVCGLAGLGWLRCRS
jgi:predicted MFS family arabinose efflux permease